MTDDPTQPDPTSGPPTRSEDPPIESLAPESGTGSTVAWRGRPERAEPRPEAPAAPPLGRAIGAFRIVRILGEGGMGVVYLAEQQQPVQRRVALKLMRSSLVGDLARLRFEAERQALARLSHPNVAAMFEAGTTPEGFPYFVMELVEGRPITQDADRRRLGVRERVALFVEVCRGVEHAHRKGIIHRDIKPSNVLVAEVEGRPVPKIIDFGIARTVEAQDQTMTHGGLIGTPAYMSPEALGGGEGEDLDTRTDVYSLGVMLHELLAGVRPHATEGKGFASLAREVSEEDAPPLPARYRTLSPEAKEQVAGARGTDPRRLSRALAGDLTWIVAKATARVRDDRYGSAAALAEDLRNWLDDLPVSAAPPSLSLRMRKFVRRHRAGVAAGAVAVLALVGGVVGTTRAMFKAREAQAQAEGVAGFLSDLLDSGSPWQRGKEVTVRELLDEAAQRIPQELRNQPGVQAEIMYTVGSAQFHLRHFEVSRDLLQEAARLWERQEGPSSTNLARVQNNLALTMSELGKPAEAQALLERSIVIRRKVLGNLNAPLARGLFDLAGIYESQHRLAEAEAAYREALAIRERMYAAHHPDINAGWLALSYTGLGHFLSKQGRYAEAEPLLKKALEMRRQQNGPNYAYGRVLTHLAGLYLRERRFRESEACAREAIAILEKYLDVHDVRIAFSTSIVANALREQGRLDEAEPFAQRTLTLIREDPQHSLSLAEGLEELALLREAQGRAAEAAELRKQAKAWVRKPAGASP